MKYIIAVAITFSFLFAWNQSFSQEINTGNILTNSTFGTGSTTTTTGWSTDGDHGIHTHGAWNGFPYGTGMDSSGGVLAFEGDTEDNVHQDVDLVGDGHLTQYQINQGFTSTMAADVWFWNNIENTFTLKQTVTGSDGSVSTQVREINDHDPNRAKEYGTHCEDAKHLLNKVKQSLSTTTLFPGDFHSLEDWDKFIKERQKWNVLISEFSTYIDEHRESALKIAQSNI